ncbi:hypothetical protein E2C01_014400 [Portunus trituberculatus]|uniref:Uncharacterized protein n=1 Tax=Portunus trituberculatus TaxID=210409 RepID=A0A5B7DJZ9_PORTR|nr:hypothetical protein [Portunus trituberculatus]
MECQTSLETIAPSEEAQPTLGLWTGFEPVHLETPRIPKHAWFHCTTVESSVEAMGGVVAAEGLGGETKRRQNPKVVLAQHREPLSHTHGGIVTTVINQACADVASWPSKQLQQCLLAVPHVQQTKPWVEQAVSQAQWIELHVQQTAPGLHQAVSRAHQPLSHV